MSDTIKKLPQIRFSGFTDVWEQRVLGDIFNILDGDRGKNYPGESDFLESGATLFLDTGNVKKNGFKFSTKKYITKEKDELLRSGKLELHDFVLTSRGTLGNVAYYDEKTRNNHPSVRINSAMLILRPSMRDEVSDDYMASVLRGNIIDTFMAKNHVGSAQPHITKRDFSNVNIGIPTDIEEQNNIGSFFKTFDNLITLQQRKLELLKDTKKSLLQKMFPKDGANVPEIRFAGFTDAWEQLEAKKLCTISTGKGNTQDKVEYGEYPFYVRSATIERSNDFLYDQEAVLTVGDGVGTGKVFHYVNGKYNLHQRVYRMYDFKHTVSAKYFYYYFSKNFYRRVMTMTAKTSVDSVRMEMIADMDIKFPSEPEQRKVVDFFDNLDKTIALHQRELRLLKNFKKSMLQQMFV
ncbi:restriction endonuclease subunit S [Lysinibacillus xylanilyticus]|uniref:restriction endonuclease subunit S n=1 Tax=Lysinibacillus xylanilyticus TaxID=582475 RepID=UPI003D072646